MQQYMLEVTAFCIMGSAKRSYSEEILAKSTQEAVQRAKELAKTEAHSEGADVWRFVGAFLYQYTGKKILGLFPQRKCVANVSCVNTFEQPVTVEQPVTHHLEFFNPATA